MSKEGMEEEKTTRYQEEKKESLTEKGICSKVRQIGVT